MRTLSKNNQTAKSAGKRGNFVAIDVSFKSNWLRKWHVFSGPITKRNKENPKQFQINFDTQLKMASHASKVEPKTSCDNSCMNTFNSVTFPNSLLVCIYLPDKWRNYETIANSAKA